MSTLIALDCGHGLRTPGKRTPNGIHEWELNDKIRDWAVYYLLKDWDVSLIFPDNDEGITDEALTARRDMYVKAGVAAFVSIHCNALKGDKFYDNLTGTEVFVDEKHTSKDMTLAECIYKYLVKYSGLRGRGIKKANFTVIYQNKIPAVLVECGFMDSSIDYPVLTSEKGQQAFGKAVAYGLVDFLGLKKNISIPSTGLPKGVEPYSGYIEIVYGGKDGIDLHKTPTFKGNVSRQVYKGTILTVKGRIKVDGTWMYYTKAGEFITSAKEYVSYRTTLHETTTKPKPSKPKMTAKQFAKEVWFEGKHGTGQARKREAEHYGVDYKEVQRLIKILASGGKI